MEDDELNYIVAALGGDVEEGNVRQCPGCKEVYAEKIGCTQVRCPNLQCNTWFCWKCGKDDINWMHLIGKCHPGYDDLLKALYPVKFFLDIGLFMTFFITPSIFLILYVFGPLTVAIGAPAYFIYRMRMDSAVLKICSFVALFPVGSALAVLALLPITLIWLFYLALFFMKTIPIFGQFADWIASCFGHGGWFAAYIKAEEQSRAERARNRNHCREQRKRRIKTP